MFDFRKHYKFNFNFVTRKRWDNERRKFVETREPTASAMILGRDPGEAINRFREMVGPSQSFHVEGFSV